MKLKLLDLRGSVKWNLDLNASASKIVFVHTNQFVETTSFKPGVLNPGSIGAPGPRNIDQETISARFINGN